MSKLFKNDSIEVHVVRNENNVILDNFVIKNLETLEYIVCNQKVDTWDEMTSEMILSPVTKNYADVQDMVRIMALDPTLKTITPEGLTAIRSERGKRAWAKKKALAEASAE